MRSPSEVQGVRTSTSELRGSTILPIKIKKKKILSGPRNRKGISPESERMVEIPFGFAFVFHSLPPQCPGNPMPAAVKVAAVLGSYP